MHIAIVGAGFAGLFTAYLAARQELGVTLVSQGRGGLAMSHGGLEVWASGTPSRALPQLNPHHPYRLASPSSLREGIDTLRAMLNEAGHPLQGSLSRNQHLLTSAGEIRRVCFFPASAAVMHVLRDRAVSIGFLPGLRDYYPRLLADRASSHGLKIQALVELPLLDIPQKRGIYALDLARFFDREAWRRELIRAWKPRLTGVTHLLLPACLGMDKHTVVRDEMREQLGCTVFEIPTLPPSVPGLRMELVLTRALQDLGVEWIQGSRAVGRIHGVSKGRRVAGLALSTAGVTHVLNADAVILASGGVLHGGIQTVQKHEIREPIFQIPLDHPDDRTQWTAQSPFDPQPFSRLGVHVNEAMQPLDARGDLMYENLFAAGGLIAGSDRTLEGTRQGIDIATAYQAVLAALEPIPTRTRGR